MKLPKWLQINKKAEYICGICGSTKSDKNTGFCENGHDYWVCKEDLDNPELNDYISGCNFSKINLSRRLK